MFFFPSDQTFFFFFSSKQISDFFWHEKSGIILHLLSTFLIEKSRVILLYIFLKMLVSISSKYYFLYILTTKAKKKKSPSYPCPLSRKVKWPFRILNLISVRTFKHWLKLKIVEKKRVILFYICFIFFLFISVQDIFSIYFNDNSLRKTYPRKVKWPFSILNQISVHTFKHRLKLQLNNW